MVESNKNRRSIRLKNYDYSKPGYYFLTICSFKKRCLFGKIEGNQVLLSQIGKVIEKCWNDIPRHFPTTAMDQCTVMPKHIHGILVINRFRRGEACLAPTPDEEPKTGLSNIVASFKSAVSKRVNELRGTQGESVWQRNYYEHVVRDEGDLYKIREYISNNPLQWALDEENPDFSGLKMLPL